MSATKPNNAAAFIPAQWVGRDGLPLTDDTTAPLNANIQDIHAQCQHLFSEALQLGCSEEFLRIVLRNMVDSLERTTQKPM